jgi:DNA anti-recombination protein RmuC
MYVPAETVYYEIINNIKDADIASYARSKKVIMTSPNTFFLSVSAISHWFRDYQTSKQTKEIIKRLDVIAKDAARLSDDFRRLGKHLSDAHSSYESSEKRLGLMVGRVKNVLGLEGEEEDIEKIEKSEDNLLIS